MLSHENPSSKDRFEVLANELPERWVQRSMDPQTPDLVSYQGAVLLAALAVSWDDRAEAWIFLKALLEGAGENGAPWEFLERLRTAVGTADSPTETLIAAIEDLEPFFSHSDVHFLLRTLNAAN